MGEKRINTVFTVTGGLGMLEPGRPAKDPIPVNVSTRSTHVRPHKVTVINLISTSLTMLTRAIAYVSKYKLPAKTWTTCMKSTFEQGL